MKKLKVGVIVGRFQVPDLHEGHKWVIRKVAKENDICLILLGQSQVRGTIRDPLPEDTRIKMIREAKLAKNIYVWALKDHPSDVYWSYLLDYRIKEFVVVQLQANPNLVDVRLYGGRDSFIPHYSGKFKVVQLKSINSLSGTEIRQSITERVNSAFRTGMIFQARTQYPRTFPTVDIACVGGPEKAMQVIMGKKTGEAHWRFPGGFVDPKDNSLEVAAARELKEETGMIAKECIYIKSFRMEDWRYSGTRDGILTSLFICFPEFGCPREPKAADDLSKVEWKPILPKFVRQVEPIHRPLYLALLDNVGISRRK